MGSAITTDAFHRTAMMQPSEWAAALIPPPKPSATKLESSGTCFVSHLWLHLLGFCRVP